MNVIWTPQPKQILALESDCDELFYGGAKGGGKTDLLLFGALRYKENPRYKALIVRRTFPRLKEIIDRSMIFRKIGGKYNKTEKTWRFKKGSQLVFGHCQNEGDELNYQGHQYHYIGFDQVEEFTEDQFNVISACGRKVDDIPIFIRCTANPGGVGKLWVRRRWIEGKEPNKVYEFETEVLGRKIKRRSIFIPSTIYDNKILMDKDPEYLAFLLNLPEKFQKMYLQGDFSIEDDPDQLIHYLWIQKAKANVNKDQDEEIYIGGDIGRFGDDPSELAYLKGNKLIKLREFKGLDNNQMAQIFLKEIRENNIKPENIGIDTVGLGSGVFDIIKSNGYLVNSIGSGESALELRSERYRFNNLRSQMHWYFRERLRLENLILGISDRELEEEMLAIKYTISSERRISVESKKSIKKRIGRSTNKHDAVIYGSFIKMIKEKLRPHIY